MKVPVNTKYVGAVLIILSLALFLIMYNFSQTMLEIIDSGEIGSCQSYEVCPHVMVLNQAYLGYFLALVIFIIGVFMLIFGGKQERIEGGKSKWENISKTLTGDEKSMYETLMGSEGVMFQSELVEKSGFPKAKVSRILDKMEARGLLEKRRRGMTNAVVLK
ncbi:MAG: MarR family transcriptional regulator [Candidatus Aenigmatarchaeota archaeon]|nr:MAG: MarR family transcriptional regulator [Candidatus Aenigmarchaeota archaeon]